MTVKLLTKQSYEIVSPSFTTIPKRDKCSNPSYLNRNHVVVKLLTKPSYEIISPSFTTNPQRELKVVI